MNRSIPFLAALPLALALTSAACDDINKPAAVPKSENRTSCFSDVECPGGKCVKASTNDIQGSCVAGDAGASGGVGSGNAPSSTDDAGSGAPTTAPTTPPEAKPSANDVHL